MFRIEEVRGKIPVAMTIAGSDSGGGAGIQADLKTFAALGVHGSTAITSITAQNTESVVAVEDLKPEVIRQQIRVVAEDLGIDAGKTGMLHTEEIVRTVSSEVSRREFPLVVDPVMIAKSGVSLLEPKSMDALEDRLLPIATVVTPNRFEAERLAAMEIKNLTDAKAAAKKISGKGPKAVVIKGGHLEGDNAIDLLYYEGKSKTFSTPRFDVKTTHGTGCSFSAAITAELAKGEDLPVAVEKAKEIVTLGIRFGLEIGKGFGPVNPLAHIYRESSRYGVLISLSKAKSLLESLPDVAVFVPEVGMNIAMAIPYAKNVDDVAAIDGRIVRTYEGVRAVGNPRFGCSSHLAGYILEIMKHDATRLAAINLRFSEETLRALNSWNMTTSSYDRRREPEEIKKIEGMSVPWGARQAIEKAGSVPDAIYHMGDVGKEPMIVIFGRQAYDLAKLTVQLAKVMKKGESGLRGEQAR